MFDHICMRWRATCVFCSVLSFNPPKPNPPSQWSKLLWLPLRPWGTTSGRWVNMVQTMNGHNPQMASNGIIMQYLECSIDSAIMCNHVQSCAIICNHLQSINQSYPQKKQSLRRRLERIVKEVFMQALRGMATLMAGCLTNGQEYGGVAWWNSSTTCRDVSVGIPLFLNHTSSFLGFCTERQGKTMGSRQCLDIDSLDPSCCSPVRNSCQGKSFWPFPIQKHQQTQSCQGQLLKL